MLSADDMQDPITFAPFDGDIWREESRQRRSIVGNGAFDGRMGSQRTICLMHTRLRLLIARFGRDIDQRRSWTFQADTI